MPSETPRVTADTNIYISALNFKGKPLEVLTLARRGTIQLAISKAIYSEIKRSRPLLTQDWLIVKLGLVSLAG